MLKCPSLRNITHTCVYKVHLVQAEAYFFFSFSFPVTPSFPFWDCSFICEERILAHPALYASLLESPHTDCAAFLPKHVIGGVHVQQWRNKWMVLVVFKHCEDGSCDKMLNISVTLQNE